MTSPISPNFSAFGPSGQSIANNQIVTINGVAWTANNYNVAPHQTAYSLLMSTTTLARFEALTGQNDPDFDDARLIRSLLVDGAGFPYFTPVVFEATINWALNAPYPTVNQFNVLIQMHGGIEGSGRSPPFSINILPNGSGGEMMVFDWNYQTPNGPFTFATLGSIPFARNTNYDVRITYTDGHGYNLGSVVAVVNGVTQVNFSGVTGHALAVTNSNPSFGYYGGVVSGVPVQQNNVVTANNPTFTIGTTPTIPLSYIDGTLGAPVVAAGPQYPTLLNGYTKVPNWNVAGVAYPVGIPDSSLPLKNPLTSVPAGCSVSGTTLTVNQAGVYLDGYDFSVSGGVNIVCAQNSLDIINCNFDGANYRSLANGVISFSGADLTVRYCKISGGFTAAGATTTPLGLIYCANGANGALSFQYNWFLNCAHTVLRLGSSRPLNCQYNLFDNINVGSGGGTAYVTWNSGAVEILYLLWQFNTSRQISTGLGATVGTTFFDANAANEEFFSLVCQYNTAVAPGATAGQTMSYIFEGNPTSAKIGSQSILGNNYADFRGALGMFQPNTWVATPQLTINPNYNMVTGAVVNPNGSVISPAFYVAPATATPPGNDSNAGTIAAPFLTFNKASAAMTASATTKTTYVRSGTYTVSSPWTTNSNQAYRAYPGDPPGTAIINFSTTLSGNSGTGPFSNITLYGLVFNGNATGTTDPIFQWSATNSLVIQDCKFTVTTTMGSMHIYNPNGLRLQGCSFTAPSNNTNNHFSITINDGLTHTDNIVNSNTLVGCGRFPIEWQCINSEILVNNHCDYNNISNWDATGTTSAGAIAISFVGAKSTSNSGNTCSFNTLTEPSGNTIPNLFGIEIDVWGVTCQSNTVANVTTAYLVGAAGNFLSNAMTGATHSWLDDGGGSYVASSVQIGANTINGSAVTGCTAPGLCGLTPAPSGSQPVWPASSPFSG